MMKQTVLAAGVALAVAAACQPVADESVSKKLDEINKKLDALDKKVAAGPQRPNMPQQPSGPDPNTVYSVAVDGSPFKGPKHAKVTMVEAFEFACPFCERVSATTKELLKIYGNDLKIVAKQYVVHPQQATLPAQAVCAAHKQGKYGEMEEGLWEKGFRNNRNFAEDNLVSIAQGVGLNVEKFKADLNGEECKKQVQNDMAQMAAVGVRGTPAFYINGRYLSGAQPIENFKRIIDEELKKANDAIAKGMKVEDYYTEVVVKAGKKGV